MLGGGAPPVAPWSGSGVLRAVQQVLPALPRKLPCAGGQASVSAWQLLGPMPDSFIGRCLPLHSCGPQRRESGGRWGWGAARRRCPAP